MDKSLSIVVDLPLLNLWLPNGYEKTIRLSNNECIRRVSTDELRLQRQPISFFVLEVVRDGSDLTNIGNEMIAYARFFMKVLTLFKIGRIGYGNPVYVNPKTDTFDDYQKNYKLTIIDTLSTRSMGIWNPNYRLLENEIDQLVHFYNRMRSVHFEKDNRLDYSIIVSLERLARTSTSIEIYEKLLDCMMSLEAIFLENEGELSYRLSHRISNIIGSSEIERSRIFDFLKRCYVNRSKILHGGQYDIEEWGYIYAIEDLEEISRRCLRRVIALSQLRDHSKDAKRQFLGDLDRSTFDSELRSNMQSYEKQFFGIECPSTPLNFLQEKK